MQAQVRLIDRITGSAGVIGAYLVLPLIICACFEVFSRYVLGAPTVWAFELGYMLTGANFLLGMPFALRERAHIRIEVVYQYFPEWLRTLADSVTYLFIIAPISAWLSLGLFDYAVSAYTSGEGTGMSAWNPVIWPFRVSFVVAFSLLCLQAVAELLRCALVFRDLLASRAAASAGADVQHGRP
jgi:TRAP-type mannitol/chloroaromatic compound transport system permease small subunit